MILFPATILRRTLLTIGFGVLVATPAMAQVDGQTTGAIGPDNPGKTDRLQPASVAALKSGLDALASGDVAQARTVRDGLPVSSLDRHILVWAIALKGGKFVASGEIADAARVLPNWPGLKTFRCNSEKALLRENPDAALVVRTFGGTQPQTAQGAIVLARAYLTLGDEAAARGMLSPFWRTAILEASDEAAIIKEFGPLIPLADHRFRMERMLYAERLASAGRVAALSGARELFAAWSAVLRGDKSAGKLLDAVPAAQRAAGYAFAKARLARRGKQVSTAAAIMIAAPKDRISLVDPDAWWIERRVLSRELVDLGDMKTAYAIVSNHAAESATNQADAEFHAGWYALRGLNDPKAAEAHFARIAAVAQGPLSFSRAYYWLGRTAEAGGPGSARDYYDRASRFGTTFYGQLAAQKIGAAKLDMSDPAPSAADLFNFARREPVIAIRRLEMAGANALADTLYRDLAGQLASPGEIGLLAGMAERRGNHYLALRVGKIALARGVPVGSLSHPVGVIPADADIGGAGAALAYAIARQESEFNITAVSGAGARGLLQLLPATARAVARRAGLDYSPARLTTDAGYNAALGAAFLGEQLRRFDGSYVLTFAGYNAGPNRAREWIERYGDPRGKDLDTVIDWIERIPYAETRGYVQRVMENYQVYKMRLTGAYDIDRDLTNGR